MILFNLNIIIDIIEERAREIIERTQAKEALAHTRADKNYTHTRKDVRSLP